MEKRIDEVKNVEKEIFRGLPPLYNSKEISLWLQISRERLYSLILTEQFPVIRVSPKRLRFAKENVEKWLQERGWQPMNG